MINNRIVAWNAGTGGRLFRNTPYSIKITYSKNFGIYHQTDMFFESARRQVSGAFEVTMPRRIADTSVSIGIYADKGSIYPDTVGMTLRLNWCGKFSQ